VGTDVETGEYGRDKSWNSEIVIDNQPKSGVRKQSLKKKGRYLAVRRTKQHAARRLGRAEEHKGRRGEIEKQQNQQPYIVW
jgi:hypothetical protein